MALEALSGVVAEAAAFIFGKVLRRSFKLDPRRAERIGEWIIFGVIATAVITVTFIYS